MTTTFTFTTREEYIAYRTEWKQRYAELSVNIKKLKLEFNGSESALSKMPYEERAKAGPRRPFNVGFCHHIEIEKLRIAIDSAKTTATNLIFERHASKIEAGIQYNACKK